MKTENLNSVRGIEMDRSSALHKVLEVDIESGMPLIGDDSNKVSTPSKTLLSKISDGFVDMPSLFSNESYLKEVYVDVMQGSNNSKMGHDPMRREEKLAVKEKRKKDSNKKAAKPPRPPQGPTLDEADYMLIREISELAMLKRARVERMKAFKKMKASKSSSSSNSSTWAMIFTLVFVFVIVIQGNN